MGIRSSRRQTEGRGDRSSLKPDDIVIIPAFGTEVATRKKLEAKGCLFVDTTCGDVMSVWKRVRQYSKDTRHQHHSRQSLARRNQSHQLAGTRQRQRPLPGRFHARGNRLRLQLHRQRRQQSRSSSKNSKALIPTGFDPGYSSAGHRRGQPNHHAARRNRRSAAPPPAAMVQKYGEAEIDKHFRFFDTICGATRIGRMPWKNCCGTRWICCWSLAAIIPPTLRISRKWAKPSCRPISSRTRPRWFQTN